MARVVGAMSAFSHAQRMPTLVKNNTISKLNGEFAYALPGRPPKPAHSQGGGQSPRDPPGSATKSIAEDEKDDIFHSNAHRKRHRKQADGEATPLLRTATADSSLQASPANGAQTNEKVPEVKKDCHALAIDSHLFSRSSHVKKSVTVGELDALLTKLNEEHRERRRAIRNYEQQQRALAKQQHGHHNAHHNNNGYETKRSDSFRAGGFGDGLKLRLNNQDLNTVNNSTIVNSAHAQAGNANTTNTSRNDAHHSGSNGSSEPGQISPHAFDLPTPQPNSNHNSHNNAASDKSQPNGGDSARFPFKEQATLAVNAPNLAHASTSHNNSSNNSLSVNNLAPQHTFVGQNNSGLPSGSLTFYGSAASASSATGSGGAAGNNAENAPVLRNMSLFGSLGGGGGGGINGSGKPEKLSHWLHVTGATKDVMDIIAPQFGLEHKQITEVNGYDSNLFFTFNMQGLNEQDEFTDEQVSVAYCYEADTVISFHKSTLLDECWEKIQAKLEHRKSKIRVGQDPSFMLYALVDAVVDYAFPMLEVYARKLYEIENHMLEFEPEYRHLEAANAIKTSLLAVRMNLWRIRELLTELMQDEYSCLTTETKRYMRDVYTHTENVVQIVESQLVLCNGLLSIFNNFQNARLNDTMKALTSVSMYVLPAQFICSVYGMNFDNMPELGYEYSYYILWGFFAILFLVTFMYLRSKDLAIRHDTKFDPKLDNKQKEIRDKHAKLEKVPNFAAMGRRYSVSQSDRTRSRRPSVDANAAAAPAAAAAAAGAAASAAAAAAAGGFQPPGMLFSVDTDTPITGSAPSRMALDKQRSARNLTAATLSSGKQARYLEPGASAGGSSSPSLTAATSPTIPEEKGDFLLAPSAAAGGTPHIGVGNAGGAGSGLLSPSVSASMMISPMSTGRAPGANAFHFDGPSAAAGSKSSTTRSSLPPIGKPAAGADGTVRPSRSRRGSGEQASSGSGGAADDGEAPTIMRVNSGPQASHAAAPVTALVLLANREASASASAEVELPPTRSDHMSTPERGRANPRRASAGVGAVFATHASPTKYAQAPAPAPAPQGPAVMTSADSLNSHGGANASANANIGIDIASVTNKESPTAVNANVDAASASSQSSGNSAT